MYTGRNLGLLDISLHKDANDDSRSAVLSFKILNSEMKIALSEDLTVNASKLDTSAAAQSKEEKEESDWNCKPWSGEPSIARLSLAVFLILIMLIGQAAFFLMLIVALVKLLLIVKRLLLRRFRKAKKA